MTELPTVTADVLRRMPLPQPDHGGDKEERGRVLAIGGSVEVPGGIMLAGIAALRAGAGKLQMATCRSIALPLALQVPEARVFGLDETAAGDIEPGAAESLIPRVASADAVLIGPGMLEAEAAADLTVRLLNGTQGRTFILDAAAMRAVCGHAEAVRRHEGRIILTPHAGEMAGLLGIERSEVNADPLGIVQDAARRLQTIVALKGACTHIATPDGEVWACSHGNVGLATSGSGDTLAGFIAGLLARGAEPVQATIWGVYLHGEAGNRLARSRGKLGFLARELLSEVPKIMAEFADAEG